MEIKVIDKVPNLVIKKSKNRCSISVPGFFHFEHSSQKEEISTKERKHNLASFLRKILKRIISFLIKGFPLLTNVSDYF